MRGFFAKHPQLIVVAAMAVVGISATALPTDYYANTSRLSSGKWVKVRVTDEGVQQITYSQLREWGFDNPERVKVYGYGGTSTCSHTFSTAMPDDLQPTVVMHTADERLLFYGTADVRVTLSGCRSNGSYSYSVDRNFYSTSGYYFLTDSDVGGEVADAVKYVAADNGASINSHYSVSLYEHEAVSPGTQGVVFHTRQYNPGDVAQVSFIIKDYCPVSGESADRGTVTFELAALSSKTSYTFKFPSITTEGDALPVTSSPLTVYNCTDGSQVYVSGSADGVLSTADGESVADGTYTFSTTMPDDASITYLALDRATLTYPRKNTLSEASIDMHFPNVAAGSNFSVSGANANTVVWNVTNPSHVFAHDGVYDADNGTFTGSFGSAYSAATNAGECRLVAFDAAAAHNAVEYVGNVENQNIHGDSVPDMVIVTTDALLPYADALADLHRQKDGFDVNVYTQTQLFNEFGSGTPSPMAVRRALKMFYDRDNAKFKCALMYGKSLYDFRQLSCKSSVEPLIMLEAEPTSGAMATAASFENVNFASDDYLGFLDDDDTIDHILSKNSKLNICVGRIPAESASYAHDVNAKIADYIDNPLPAEAMMRALVTSDNGELNKHMQQAVLVGQILKANRPGLTVIQGHTSIYPHSASDAPTLRNKIKEALNTGVGLFTYNGHGNTEALAAEDLWSIEYANSTDYKHAPLALLATCNSISVDRQTTGISNTMLQKNNGGAIAVIGTCRTVYLDDNTYVCKAMANTYASLSGTVSIGEIYRRVRNAANSSITVVNAQGQKSRANLMCYMLLGDPALCLHMPERSVAVTTINEQDVDDGVGVNTLSTAHITANVLTADGKVATDFNGTATITLYEAPHDVSTYIVDSTDRDEAVTLDEDVLCTMAAEVIGGVINADMFIPVNVYPSSEDLRNRITVVATSANGTIAAGRSIAMYLNDDDNDVPADTSFAVTDMYINRPDNADNIPVSSAPTVYAVINIGSAGIKTSNAIGADSYLILDGTKISTAKLPITLNPDGTASLQYALSDIADGAHIVTLCLVDNLGNQATRSVSFTVGTTVSLTADKTTVHDEVEFSLTHTYADQPTCRLIIENMSGDTVFTVTNPTFPYTWHLRDNTNTTVPDGSYTVHVQTSPATASAGTSVGTESTATGYLSTPRLRLTVLR